MHQLQVTIVYHGEQDGVGVDLDILASPDDSHQVEFLLASHLRTVFQDFMDQAYLPAEGGGFDVDADHA